METASTCNALRHAAASPSESIATNWAWLKIAQVGHYAVGPCLHLAAQPILGPGQMSATIDHAPRGQGAGCLGSGGRPGTDACRTSKEAELVPSDGLPAFVDAPLALRAVSGHAEHM